MAAARQKARRSRAEAQERRARAERLLGLFAWHRDAPLVARSLGLSLDELHAELDELKLRRKAYRLVRGSDAEIPIVKAVPGAPSGPPLRRRRSAPSAAPVESEPPQSPPPGSVSSASQPATAETAAPDEGGQVREETGGFAAVAQQAAQLRALLAEVGPRRAALAERLGSARQPLPDRIVLARFRAAGLEREFSQRERDLLRALFARHRGSGEAVAAELKVDADALQRLVRERGLEREVERLRRPLRHRRRRPR